MLEASPTYLEWDMLLDKSVMTRREVEALRKRAVSCACTYAESGAYLRVRASELKAVCDVALSSFAEDEKQLELSL
jgi:hypothetical protein